MDAIPTGRRAQTAGELRAVVRQMRQQKPALPPPNFVPRPSDILIATYPKCGTTWCQQIVHGLRTRGAMDFEEISLVVPWLEHAETMGIDPEAEQVAAPRAFKTHAPWYMVPKGGRSIFITREPGDVLVSFYHFFKDMVFEGDEITIEVFADELFFAPAALGRCWDHIKSWWQVRERDDVLFLCYEDLKHDLRAAVVRIAEFCHLEADDALIDLATHQAGFGFMKAHESQFDDHPTTLALTRKLGFPPAQTSKVRTGRVGDRKQALPASVVTALDQAWQQDIAEPLGFGSYAELRAALAADAAPA